MSSSMADQSPVYDLVCIGFGPAQIATAIANREARKSSNILFLERKPSFSWHSTHLVRTRMEAPFVYDLATLRNPRSAFSYVNYLLAQGRLVEFANSDRLNPLRLEFEDYLRWCAEQFKDQVRYGHEVTSVAPEEGEGPVKRWNVAVKDVSGKTSTIHVRSIVASSPSGRRKQKQKVLTGVDFLAGQRIISTADYLSRRNSLRDRRETRLNVAVVGSGQHTVEILDDLVSCPWLGNVIMVTENESLAPLRVLGDDPEPPAPQLCSIWASPACKQKATVTDSSELIRSIYGHGYEKKMASKGAFKLRVVMGGDVTEACSKADVIISEHATNPTLSSGLFQGLDSLVLGCRQKGESLEEVQFKRGTVSETCRMWLLSARSEGGRSLAKDIAQRAGEIVRTLAAVNDEGRALDGSMIPARM
jgi:L-ornithine N5-oxygenase